MQRVVSEMSFPTSVALGPGAVERAGAWCRRLGIKKPLIITDPGVVAAGLADRLMAVLAGEGVGSGLYAGVHADPTDEVAEDGVKAFLEAGGDGVVALGGGSALDAAKLVRLLATHERPLARYDLAAGGEALITQRMPPMIAVPTTAGTGSEVSARAVALLKGNGRRVVIGARALRPEVALCDPELTTSLPPGPTAWSGMGAFARCLEALLATGFHPLADALAVDGLARCGRALVRAVREPGALAPRTDLLTASVESAAAAEKGLGACEALANATNLVTGLRHGTVAALLLPAVLDFNRPAAGRRLAKAAVALGEPADAGDDRLAAAAIVRVRALRAEVGLPERLGGLGVREEQLALIAEKALGDPALATNPRYATVEDLLAVVRAAW